ncbi:unnamed protein product [Schistosoma bovis]|nr:unnamed protein product [Schistosoma bovis]CAH8464766.1 unnamed protein product [Schistosoma bovis]
MEVIRGMCKRLGMCRSLETTLPGYLFDDLNWCDKTLTGMTNYGTSCGCDRKIVVRAYWESASAECYSTYHNRFALNSAALIKNYVTSNKIISYEIL